MEGALAEYWGLDVDAVRRQVWRNLIEIADCTARRRSSRQHFGNLCWLPEGTLSWQHSRAELPALQARARTHLRISEPCEWL